MANEQNLRPFTKENAKERARAGGIASAKARRRKANLRKAMHDLLTSPGPTLEGIQITYEEALALAMVNEALGGGKNNVSAYNAIMATLKLDREDAERRMRVAKMKAEIEEIKRRMDAATGGGEAPVVIIDDVPDEGDAGGNTAVFDALGESHREIVDDIDDIDTEDEDDTGEGADQTD